MVEKCHQVITETDANPPPIDGELDVGFIASFWMYPKGDALSSVFFYISIHLLDLTPIILAFLVGIICNLVIMQKMRKTLKLLMFNQQNIISKRPQSYPEDEEVILTFYTTSLEAYWYQPQGKTLADMFPLLKSITASLPNVLRIWEYSAAAQAQSKTPRMTPKQP